MVCDESPPPPASVPQDPELLSPNAASRRGGGAWRTGGRGGFRFGFAFLLVTSVHLVAAPPLADPTRPDVLILNSYAPDYQWSDDEQAGLLAVVRTRFHEFEPVIQYLDFKRFTEPGREAWLIEDVAHKCRVRPPALIITLDNAAFDFALKYRARLGADVPVVFGGVNRFTPDMIAGQTRITGVSEESDFGGTFELIRCLTPATRHILVISDQTESGLESRKVFETFAPHHADRYAYEFYDHWTDAELIERVATLPDGWVGLILEATRDAAGRSNYNNADFSKALASRARVPVFLTSRPPGNNDWSIYPWDGIGGGMVVAEVHGAKVGELALRVLSGEDINSIPVVRHSPQRLEVDYRQMRRFGFSLAQLPPGTQVINAPVSFYQVNRARLILAGVVLLLLCAIIVVLSVNILGRHRAERALRRAEEQLRSSQKLEAIGLLAGGVAHDFNNILQVIQGHTGFLKESLTGLAQPLEEVEIIQGAAERAAQLTRQLLAFSRKQPLNPQSFDPEALVADMVKMFRRVLGEHITLQVTPLPEPCTLVADKGQIEQVLLNLCVNARDAMPGGGRLLLELQTIRLDATDADGLRDLKPGPYLGLTVSDTGCGMPPEVLDRLFEPFFTTKGPGKGTGLGLSVAYGIVRQHGGSIRVYSEVGRGSVFKVLLPMTASAPPPAAEEPAVDFPPGEGTILLAEDDPQVRSLATRLLGENGFRVLAASDGQEAQALIEQHHATIRLAVLDVLMPNRNGRQVFDFLRARNPAIRVLFCSGYSAEMLPAGIAPEAGLALINKPYSRRELLRQVHRLLAS